MKRTKIQWLSLVLALILCLGLVACSTPTDEPGADTDPTTDSVTPQDTTNQNGDSGQQQPSGNTGNGTGNNTGNNSGNNTGNNSGNNSGNTPSQPGTSNDKLIDKGTDATDGFSGWNDFEGKVSAVDTSKKLVDYLDHIKILGRCEVVDRGITCDFSASGIEFSVNVVGSVVLEVTVENQSVESHKNDDIYFTVYVDGVRSDVRYKALKGTTSKIKIAQFDEQGDHKIEIYKQSEIKNGLCTLNSLDFSGTFNDAPKAADSYIEFIGDSITSGYGNLWVSGATAHADDNLGNADTCYKDSTQAFAFLTAKALDADFSLISCAGVGVTKGWRPMLAKELFAKQSYYRSTTKAYAPAKTPDLVVINLGTNDSTKSADLTSLTNDAKALIELVRTTYGKNVKIVWAYGMMIGPNSAYNNAVLSAIEALGGEAAGLYSVELPKDTSAGGGHPNLATHQSAATTLKNFIQSKGLLAE